jgi:hypothetical protein
MRYTAPCIAKRLQAVADLIDAGGSPGSIVLLAGSAVVSTVRLALPCGVVSDGVLTFARIPRIDPAASGTGTVTAARFQDSNGNIVATVFSVGIPGSGADVQIANGETSTLINAGQAVSVFAAQISEK